MISPLDAHTQDFKEQTPIEVLAWLNNSELVHRKYEELGEGLEKSVTSTEKPLELELKQLSKHLKCAFFGENSTLPVIINVKLTHEEERKLLRVLRSHTGAISWPLSDIKGINPSICMHRILLEENSKPVIDAQRRLNPRMKEVVRKEILKWLDAGVIYPISDSALGESSSSSSEKGRYYGVSE